MEGKRKKGKEENEGMKSQKKPYLLFGSQLLAMHIDTDRYIPPPPAIKT